MKVLQCSVFYIFVIFLKVVYSEESATDENIITSKEECAKVKGIDKAITCYALNTLNKLQDTSSKEIIEIMPGVELSSDIPSGARKSVQLQTKEYLTTSNDKLSQIIDMMLNVVQNLLTSRTLKVKIPETTSNSVMRAFEEGRGKLKKLAGPLMMALGAKMFAVIPIMIGGLALLVAKALVVSKLAIIVAIFAGIQFLFSGSSTGGLFSKFGQNGWNNYGNGGGGYGYGYGGSGVYGPAWNGGSSQSYPYA